jgi:hypothetical protein
VLAAEGGVEGDVALELAHGCLRQQEELLAGEEWLEGSQCGAMRVTKDVHVRMTVQARMTPVYTSTTPLHSTTRTTDNEDKEDAAADMDQDADADDDHGEMRETGRG